MSTIRFVHTARRASAAASVLLACLTAVGAANDDRIPVVARVAGWSVAESLTLRESYDSNVFLQGAAPSSAIVGALPDRRASMVTAMGVTLTFERRFASERTVALAYSPEAVIYHSAPSESHRVHKLGAGATGRSGSTVWSFQNNATWTDGSEEGPVFGCAGGATAVGGIPLRDRRASWVGRSAFKLTHTFGPWFVRPLATAYLHDFRTRQSRQPGYLNYLDRQELVAGFDLGRELFPGARWVTGFRAGRQDQFKLHGVDSPFDSSLQRYLIGLEGTLWPWLQVNVLTGPETRQFSAGTTAGFDRDKVLWWTEGAATLALGARDVCTATIRRFEQPSFGSQGVYEDITYEVTWRRKLAERLTLGAGFKAYGGDWPGPATREDWILTPSVLLHYTFSRLSRFEFGYAVDSAESRVAATPGREYRRQLATVSTQFSF